MSMWTSERLRELADLSLLLDDEDVLAAGPAREMNAALRDFAAVVEAWREYTNCGPYVGHGRVVLIHALAKVLDAGEGK